MTAKYKERQNRKFDTLLGRVNAETRHRRQDDRWVVNLSSRSLSTAEKDVLARGLNFAVVMDREDYDKIRTLLADTGTYKTLPRDPTLSQERKMNAILLLLMRAGAIPERLYYHLRSSAEKVPLLYGLPKIHKPEIPLRPMVSFVNSPTYALSKHLVSILSPLVGKSPSHVRISADFASFIAGQTIHQGITLVSFDVVSLYTKIPVNLATKVAWERLTADQSLVDHTVLSPDEVVSLLEFFSRGHVYVLQRGDVPAGLWHSYGVTSLRHSGQPGDGGRQAKGSHFLHNPTTLLEAVCG